MGIALLNSVFINFIYNICISLYTFMSLLLTERVLFALRKRNCHISRMSHNYDDISVF